MKLNEIVYNLKNQFAAGHQSDDIDISDRQMVFMINGVRNYMMNQEQYRNKFKHRNLHQTLKPVELRKIDRADNCYYETDCEVLISVKDLPKHLQLKGVYTLADEPLEVTSKARSFWKKYDKFGSTSPTMYFLDNRLIIENPPKGLKYVKIVAHWENPLAVQEFNNEFCRLNNMVCPDDNMEFEYPLPAELLHNLEYHIKTRDFNFIRNQPEDSLNDTSEE